MMSVDFYCECGMHGWMSEGRETSPCPKCKKVYIGYYDEGKSTLVAKEVKNEKSN